MTLRNAARRTGARKLQRAFTLIEVVVSLALIAMIAAALTSSLRFGQRSYEQVLRKGGASWDVFASQRLIRTLVESAYPQESSSGGVFAHFGIDGGSDAFSVTAPAPLALGGGGFYRYDISLRGHGAGKDVVVRWGPDFASAVGAAADARLNEEVLIENVADVQWSYVAADSQAPLDETGASWRDQWRDTQRLPVAVRLKVRFREGDSRRWPDLVMATRLTADANCVFDVVSQQCRGSS